MSASILNRRLLIALSAAMTVVLLFSTALLAPARAATPEVSASLAPAHIGVDQAAQLSITVTGDQDTVPVVPAVTGLQITPMGQSSSYQSINGVVSANVTHSYAVTAAQPGDYRIPAIAVGGALTEPLDLHVGTGSAAAASGAVGSAPAVNGRSGFIRVILPKRNLYVGEVMPIEIKAYVPQDESADVQGPPTLSSDAFTVSRLDDTPTQSTEVVGRVPYTVLTWKSVLGAVKSGNYAVDLQLPLTVSVTMRSDEDDDLAQTLKSFFGNDPFGSALDMPDMSSMMGRVVERPVTLKSNAQSVRVLALPSGNRPADFSGAVGHFTVDSTVTPTQGAAGDPLTLKFTVAGDGNFARVNSSGLPSSANWRAYRPQVSPSGADSSNTQGQKTFEQAVIPLRSGAIQLPAVTFSYFDPQAGRYVTEHTRPIPIEVTPGQMAPGQMSPASPATQTVATAAAVAAPNPNPNQPGPFVHSLRPVLFRPWFMAATTSPLLLMSCGLWLGWRRDQREADPVRRRKLARNAAVKAQMAAMAAALEHGDAAGFFGGARRVLQEQIAFAWGCAPAEVDTARVHHQLGARGAQILAVFGQAEKAAYAHEVPPPQELDHWRAVVQEELQKWEQA